MDRNLLLAFALSFMVLTTWTLWQERQQPEGRPRGEEVSRPVEPGLAAPDPVQPELPSGGIPVPPVEIREPAVAESGRELQITRKLYHAQLSSLGGELVNFELLTYRDLSGSYVALLSADERISGGARTPFLELGSDLSREEWDVVEATDEVVGFELERNGVTIRKGFSFEEEGYAFRMRLEVINGSSVTIEPRFLVGWPGRNREGNDFREQAMALLQDGGVENEPLAGLGTAGFFSDAKQQYVFQGEIDWAGIDTPYFLSAMFPDAPALASARFLVQEPGVAGMAEIFFAATQIPPGNSAIREYRFYVGPKEVERLEALGSGAIRSIDLGWSWIAPLTRLFGWLLSVLYSVTGNYGVAIIVLTILVRVVTAPLTVKQMKSMERMRQLQPKVKELQEKFKDEREKQSKAMMDLYKQEKVNPLGGCFPMLLQLPVFIGLFYALRSSIQLRQAPFFGWIDDLSAPESLFELPGVGVPVRVLPLIMGASMVLQQKITPTQMDPAQAKMMMTVMPIMMTVLFYQFPSGLVLYWMMSNLLAIAHQLWIGRGLKPATS